LAQKYVILNNVERCGGRRCALFYRIRQLWRPIRLRQSCWR